MPEMPEGISNLRHAIDQLDEQILDLLQQRAQLAQQVFEHKRAQGEGGNSYRPQREAQVLDSVLRYKQANYGDAGLQAQHLGFIFREIISACLSLEQSIKVGYLGPEGTFTQAAALRNFGHSCQLQPLSSIAQIFAGVKSKEFNFGVVPIENSNEGMVGISLRLLEQMDLYIIGEVILPIQQHLLAPAGVELAAIKQVYAHQQSLGQCQNWLSTHLPTARLVETRSNAEAARLVSERSTDDSAALGAAICAEIYQLSVLAARTEDNPNNFTRFVVIGDYPAPAGDNDKTSLVISADNKPGALYRLLKCFYDEQLDMTRLESQPVANSSWQYKFFIDCRGHIDNPALQRCFSELQKHSLSIKHLGSYPAARELGNNQDSWQ